MYEKYCILFSGNKLKRLTKFMEKIRINSNTMKRQNEGGKKKEGTFHTESITGNTTNLASQILTLSRQIKLQCYVELFISDL